MFGTFEVPKAPWRYVRGAGCQMGLVCPADRCSERHGSAQGMPIQKQQQWLANFSLSAFGLRCRNPKALVRVLRMTTLMPKGA